MTEKNQVLSSDNLPTIVAVCFVLALLAISGNYYNFTRINTVYGFMAQLNNYNMQGVTDNLIASGNRIDELKARVDIMDKKLTAMDNKSAPAPEDGAAPK